MTTHHRLAALALAALASAAGAQTTSAYDANRSSWLPYTRNGYVGFNIGSPRYDTPCGVGFGCDNPNTSYNLYLGGYFNPYVGAEIGYLHMGDASRGGGTQRAQGLNLSLVGRVPIGQMFSLFGKIGTTYGRTTTDASPASGLVAGSESGWGGAYALGATMDFSNNWGVVLEWQRHRFHFAGDRQDDVRTVNLGVRYRF